MTLRSLASMPHWQAFFAEGIFEGIDVWSRQKNQSN